MVITIEKKCTNEVIGFTSFEKLVWAVAEQACVCAPPWRGRYEVNVTPLPTKGGQMTLIWDPAPGHTFHHDLHFEPLFKFAEPVKSGVENWTLWESEFVREALRWAEFIRQLHDNCIGQERLTPKRYSALKLEEI